MTTPKGSTLIILIILMMILGGGYIFLFDNILNSNPFIPNTFNKGPLTSEPVSFNLNLSSPDDNRLVFSPDLLISGTTSAGATVIISFETDDLVVEAGSSGNFSLTVKLDEGVNQFKVSSFDDKGNSKSESRTIYYSKEKL